MSLAEVVEKEKPKERAKREADYSKMLHEANDMMNEV